MVPGVCTAYHSQLPVLRKTSDDRWLSCLMDGYYEANKLILHIGFQVFINEMCVIMQEPLHPYLPKGELKSGRSRATAIKTFLILALGTYPTAAVWYLRMSGKPVVMEGLFL